MKKSFPFLLEIKDKKTFFWLGLFFMAPFLPYLNLAYDFDLSLLRVLLVVVELGIILNIWRRKKYQNWRLSKTSFLLTIFLLWSFGSLFWAPNFTWGARKLILWINFFLLVLLAPAWLGKKEERGLKISKAIVWSGVAMALVGAGQFVAQWFFSPEKIFSFWLQFVSPIFTGASLSGLVNDFPSWFFDFNGTTMMRAVSFFPDPHMLGFFLGMTFFLSWGIFLATKEKKYLIAEALLLAGITLTFSRGAYLALLTALVLTLPLFLRRIEFRLKKTILGTISGFFLVLVFFGGPVIGRFFSSFDATEGSNQGRIVIWTEALSLAQEKIFVGRGLGSYPFLVNPAAEYRSPVSAHNLYLEILTELGVMGLSIFLALIGVAFWRSWQRQKTNALFLGTSAALVYFLVHSFFEVSIYNPVILLVFCWLLLFPDSFQKQNCLEK